MLLLLIRISETYPRIDPKHHAKPPSGEMHLSHCRVLPFLHFQFPGFPSQCILWISRSIAVRVFHDTLLLFCSVESPAIIPTPCWVAASIVLAVSTSLRRPPCRATIRRPDQVSCVHLAPRCRCYGESLGNGGKGATQPPITIKRRI